MACVIKGCKSHSSRKENDVKDLTFHRFPKNEDRKNDWLKQIGRKNWKPDKNSRICSKHFEPDAFVPNINTKYRRLKRNSVPTLYLSEADTSIVGERVSASASQLQQELNLLDPNDLSDSSLISDPEETSGAPEPSAPDVGLRSLSVVFCCKTCSKNITSFRYRCLLCPDYDMCGECEGRGGHHDDHYVLRVPMQRPTVEVDRVESAVRRALASSTTWNKVLKSNAGSKAGKKKRLKKTGDKLDKTRNSGGSRDDTGNDSEDTEDEPSDIVKKTEKATPKLVTIKTEAVDSDDEPVVKVRKSGTIKTEALDSVDEPVVKVELVIKEEEEDPLEEETAESAFLQNIHERQTTSGSKDVPSTQVVPSSHITQASQGDPWSYIVPLIHGAPQPQSVPTSQGAPQPQSVPPSKRRRGDEHRFTTTTHSHKTTPTTNEPTGHCTDASSSSTVATSPKTGSKVDDFVLKKRTRPADENVD